MSDSPPFASYTKQILGFNLPGQGLDSYNFAPTDSEALAARALRASGRAELAGIILLGLGKIRLARHLAQHSELLVLEPEANLLRRAAELDLLAWLEADHLLCDSSPAALACFCLSRILHPTRYLVLLNPEEDDPGRIAKLKEVKLLLAAKPIPLQPSKAETCCHNMTIAAILRPDEPNLPGFAKALPRLGKELVLVWDGPLVPKFADDLPWPPDLELRHFARPLGKDFSAQRNFMLKQCSGEFVLYLDADERPGPGFEAALPGLLAQNLCEGVYFPRLTLFPVETRAKIGAGLWPDLQLRLFRNKPGLRFSRPVHERLGGLSGQAGLCLGAPLLHLSNLLKNREGLQAKHELFNQAAQSGLRHVQSLDYPSLELELLAPSHLRGQGFFILPPRLGWPS